MTIGKQGYQVSRGEWGPVTITDNKCSKGLSTRRRDKCIKGTTPAPKTSPTKGTRLKDLNQKKIPVYHSI